MSASDLETSPCIELTKPLWSCRLSDVWQRLFLDFWHFMMLLLCQSGNLCHHLVSRCSSGWCNPQVTKWEVIWYLTIWWHWLADQITILYRDVGIVSSRPSRVLEPMMQHSLQKNQSIHVCSDFYESNHLLSLSLPRFYDWFYFLGVHVWELIWTDWCIGQEEARLKSLFCSWRFYFHLIFNFKMCSIFVAQGQDDPVPEQIHHGDRQRTSICWMNLWVWMWNKTWHLCS